MLKKLQNYTALAKDWYHIQKKEISLVKKIKIENSLLAKELELAAKPYDGFLSFAEYLHITQFGTHGYYVQSAKHGKTDIENRWADALAVYCQTKGVTTIIEFGCGTGELGAMTAKIYQKQTKKQLSWIGIEIDTGIHQKIRTNFQKHQVESSIELITDRTENISIHANTLILFPYSLDNIAPNVFLNTTPANAAPNAVLGIKVENTLLSEVILTKEILKNRNMRLEQGIFTKNNYQYDLSTWKLRKGQRAYIATDAYHVLHELMKKSKPDTTLLIIDEFRQEPWNLTRNNLGKPRSLYEKNLVYNDSARYYRQSGKHNFYYPLYIYTLTKFLHDLGFRTVRTEIEQKVAANILGKPWFPIKKSYNTLACTAENWKETAKKTLPITFNPRKLL